MHKKTNVLIIGGGPSAIVAAITAKKRHKDKKVTVIRNFEKALIPCGIPYIFGSLESVEQNLIPDKVLLANDIELIIDEVILINQTKKTVHTKTGVFFSYEKLIIATGSLPIQVPIEGVNLPGVYEIRKDVAYLKMLKEKLLKTERVVIIGGGFWFNR